MPDLTAQNNIPTNNQNNQTPQPSIPPSGTTFVNGYASPYSDLQDPMSPDLQHVSEINMAKPQSIAGSEERGANNGATSVGQIPSNQPAPILNTTPNTQINSVQPSFTTQPTQVPKGIDSSSLIADSLPDLGPLTNVVQPAQVVPSIEPQIQELPTIQNVATISRTQTNELPEPIKASPFVNGDLDIKKLLDIVIEKNASDLHLTVGYPVCIRVDSKLQRIGEPLTADQVKTLIYQTLSNSQRELLEVNREVDLSYAHATKARFRVNAYNERGNLAAAYRLITSKIRTIEELTLPPVLYDFTKVPQGLFLVTGPTGSGKSTTLAAMIEEINQNYAKHILTIEDPIEYVYSAAKALVDQRELGEDTHDWTIALRSALRQDPDVVLIGEMRDFDTIQAAITTAETGHLVFATLHTNSAAQSIDRIIDVFPPHQQEQVRTQLAGSLKGILSQRLIPIIGGGRQAAIELMIVTPAIQNLIREGKTYQIDNVLSTSFDIGMVTLERSLVKMIREGKITVETAQEYAIRPDEVLKLMKSGI
jgi:twitching motility protein PilT